MNKIYTRPTYLMTGNSQFKAICDTFSKEWHNVSPPQRYVENRLKMGKFEALLKDVKDGDVIYCYNPAIFGIGVGQCVESLRALRMKGAVIMSVLFGKVDDTMINAIAMAGEIVKEACSIERTREIEHNKGVREIAGGYFDEDTGRWRQGQKKSYVPPHWAFWGQRNADEARYVRDSSSARRWIDIKIMDAWTTDRIWREYRVLCSILEEDVWERVGKQWINARRLELTR